MSDGNFEDVIGLKLTGVTFCTENGLTLYFSGGSSLLLADATRRNRIFVMSKAERAKRFPEWWGGTKPE